MAECVICENETIDDALLCLACSRPEYETLSSSLLAPCEKCGTLTGGRFEGAPMCFGCYLEPLAERLGRPLYSVLPPALPVPFHSGIGAAHDEH